MKYCVQHFYTKDGRPCDPTGWLKFTQPKEYSIGATLKRWSVNHEHCVIDFGLLVHRFLHFLYPEDGYQSKITTLEICVPPRYRGSDEDIDEEVI